MVYARAPALPPTRYVIFDKSLCFQLQHLESDRIYLFIQLVRACVLSHFSHVRLFVIPLTVTRQSPASPALARGFFTTSTTWKALFNWSLLFIGSLPCVRHCVTGNTMVKTVHPCLQEVCNLIDILLLIFSSKIPRFYLKNSQ